MATIKEKNDIAALQTDVALIKRDIQYIVKQIDSFQFVPVAEFNELKSRVDKIEVYNDSNKLGASFSNLFASKAFTFVIGLIFAAIIYYVVRTGGK